MDTFRIAIGKCSWHGDNATGRQTCIANMSTKQAGPSMAPPPKKHPGVAVVAGAIAGGLEMCSIWPMELIKTNLQLGTMKRHYTSVLPGFRYHIQTGGALSLYRGLAPVFIASLPKAGLRFGAFDSIKQWLADDQGKSTPLRNMAAGMSAGAIEAILITTPTETIKTKLIDANTGVLYGVQTILQREGVRGLYQGLTATVMKQATNTGLRFLWFSEYKARVPGLLAQRGIDHNALTSTESAIVSFVGGMTAGIFSTFGNNRTFRAHVWHVAHRLPVQPLTWSRPRCKDCKAHAMSTRWIVP
ncbi:hypothetical protein, variant 1 [Aphanomyces invadans]|uniref:Tricarboxylate transporter n=1 Tax=Aphanomyces invadans TaxID=157072 RepID=A0A024TAG3_9STRA|nr:hypothetical protein, variant 1 [Aphanomyces invadans]ETV90974.1 hypothetical protein, variant 1 [Aphanomyces invadans]|eukprot:XP_008880363.1 hypothetical protein, variant 1 [Aphanomyces invadans]